MIRKALSLPDGQHRRLAAAVSGRCEAIRGEEAKLTSVEPPEIEELCGRVLGIIGAYGMGNSNPRELCLKTAPAAPLRETVSVRDVTKQQPHAAPAT